MPERPTYEDLEENIKVLTQTLSVLAKKEKEVSEKEAHYREIVEDMPLLICSFLPDGEITFVNRAYCTFFQKKYKELVGLNFLTLIPKADREAVMSSIKALSTESATQTHEHTVIAPDGKIRWQRWTNRAQFNDKGKVLAYQSIGEDITERKKAEQEIEKGQKFLNEAGRIAHLGVWVWNIDDNSEWWSDEQYRIFGFEPGEIQPDYETFTNAIHPLEKDAVLTAVKKSLEENEPYNREFRIIRPDGSIRHIHAQGKVERLNEGKPLLMTGTVLDITSRKKAEFALRESEEKYRTLFEAESESIFLVDNETLKLVECNRAATELYGYSPVELKNLKATDLSSEPDKTRNAIRAEEGNYIPIQFHRRKDGTVFPVEISATYFEFQGRKMSLSIVRDITERKQVEDELKERNLLFSQLADNIEDIFWVGEASDPLNYKVLYINNAFEHIWMHSVDEIYRDFSVWHKCIHKEDKDFVMSTFTNFLHGKGKYDLEFKIVRPDNSIRIIAAKGNLIRNEQGTIIRTVGIARDITEKRQLEAKLVQAQKMESIGHLASGIAHDFNNILSSLIGFTELAISEANPVSDQKNDLHQVLAAGNRAKELVNQILAFAHQSSEEKKPLIIHDVITEVMKFVRSSLPTSIDIVQDIRSSSLIMGNTTHIHQIVMNLCTNAAHAMRKEGGVMEIYLKDIVINESNSHPASLLVSGDYLELTVSDTGEGIDQSIINQIFDPYFTTKVIGEGTGMGLAMVKGIVESYGGEIKVKSKPDKGTIFQVYLPITTRKIRKKSETAETYPMGVERILFVDDEVPIAKMGSRILESLGYTVTQRTSSHEALELFKAKPDNFDLVITDMTMPQITGDKLTIELRKIRIDIPVILCTGYSNIITKSAVEKIGIDALLNKPFTKIDFANTVRNVLDNVIS